MTNKKCYKSMTVRLMGKPEQHSHPMCKYVRTVHPTWYRKAYLRILYRTVSWYLASEPKPVLLWILFWSDPGTFELFDSWSLIILNSVGDPWHFVADPDLDPRIVPSLLYHSVPWYLASESKPVLLWILFWPDPGTFGLFDYRSRIILNKIRCQAGSGLLTLIFMQRPFFCVVSVQVRRWLPEYPYLCRKVLLQLPLCFLGFESRAWSGIMWPDKKSFSILDTRSIFTQVNRYLKSSQVP